jgi:anhydro-N-acetylmuramic acid kinase
MPEFYIGLMSGTSIDSIDAALVSFAQDVPEISAYHSEAIPADIKDRLHHLCWLGENAPLLEVSQLDVITGHLFSKAVNKLLDSHQIEAKQVTAIGSHGQTIFHNPDSQTPSSIQIGDPNIIAENTGITTVADFRRRDIAAGGQGAPLVPAFHQAVFQRPGEDRVIVNIGGIANITILPGDKDAVVSGFDTGPGNTLLDQWVKRHQGKGMDKDAAFARLGTVDNELLKRLLSDPYFSRPPPKSTGREYFNIAWLEQYINQASTRPEDIQASLCALTAISIMQSIESHAPATKRLLVCGGGAHNPVIMQALRDNPQNIEVASSLEYGIDPDHVEAIAFAWMARQTLQHQHSSIAAVTGARSDTILGGIYPGRNSADLPDAS